MFRKVVLLTFIYIKILDFVEISIILQRRTKKTTPNLLENLIKIHFIMASASFLNNLTALQANLLNFAYMLTNNRDDAHDLLQDTMLKALDNEEKYAEGTNFKGWLFTIMRNTFINNYRRGVRNATVVDTTDNLYLLNLGESTIESPEESYSATEISKAINEFSDEYRIPFSMHLQGYKYNEIAEKMNLPLGTVKSRIFFARKKLQERFSDYR